MTKQKYHHNTPESRDYKQQSESERFDTILPTKTYTKKDEEKIDEFIVERIQDKYGVNRETAIQIYKYPTKAYTQKEVD